MNRSLEGILVERAQHEDLSAIREILSNVELPNEDVDEHLEHFFVARRGGSILGTIGMEPYREGALLRSLAVKESVRNKGIASELYEKLLRHAKEKGIKQLSLLTTTAEGYFERLGFKKVDSANIPEFVRRTKEYNQFCPSNAVCMTKEILPNDT